MENNDRGITRKICKQVFFFLEGGGVHNTLSDGAFQMHEVLSKYLKRYLSYRAYTICKKKIKGRNSIKNMQATVMVLLHDTLSDKALQMSEVFSKLLKGLYKQFVMRNYLRGITRDICKPELSFLCMTFHLMQLFKCVKFYQNI